MAFTKATNEVSWLRGLSDNLGFSDKLTIVHYDSSVVLILVCCRNNHRIYLPIGLRFYDCFHYICHTYIKIQNRTCT
jgi:hypothetical protein